MADKHTITAIVLAAGSGKRMNTDTKKQFLEINARPLVFYSLNAFENSFVDEIILVTTPEDIDFCRKEIVGKFHINKVKKIVAGGLERYDSVYNGLAACENCDYVMIHDGARPFIDSDILARAYDMLLENGNAIVAMPVKDTIKAADRDGVVINTPDRKSLWQMQTPQCFKYEDIFAAYKKLEHSKDELIAKGISITDDAMVLEYFTDTKIRLVEGSYNNIKITTREDIYMAEAILKRCSSCNADL